MKQGRDGTFELQPILRSALPDVAAFLHRWRISEAENWPTQKPARESVGSIERRLRWLLIDNPVATADSTLGYCLRDGAGVIRGLNLHFPIAFLSADKRLLGLCSGTFFVEPPARSLGFYLFKRYLSTQGYSFYFASTCNTDSSELWRSVGGRPVPNSETQYILPLRLDVLISAYVASRTSSQVAATIARMCGRSANPILRFLTRPSAKLAVEPCQDWEKLSELSGRHRSADHITSDRSPALLRWRYGPGSPSHPCGVYLFRDELGNEGWFSLGNVTLGEGGQFRASVLLDAIWPREQISYRDIFQEILRVTAATADAILFRWQPGLNYRQYSRCVIPRKLGAPRAFVSVPKGAPRFPLDSLDYDDSDYMAWTFQWTDG
ncbi:MAG: hypothetical protein ACR2IV_05710 [Bryobacteraceae bacterium]